MVVCRRCRQVGESMSSVAKPTVADLGIDVDAQTWQRSGDGPGAVEIAFVAAREEMWVLMRVADDPAGRVLVFDRHEWECFLDGAKKGEFDDAAVVRDHQVQWAADDQG